jgi:hypothetical protein
VIIFSVILVPKEFFSVKGKIIEKYGKLLPSAAMATVKGSRAPNWGEKEKAMALELIAQEAERGLFSSFRGATKGANEKREAWERVCNSLNA